MGHEPHTGVFMSVKFFKVLALSALIATASFQSQKAQAVVGLVITNKATKVTGGILGAVGGLAMAAAYLGVDGSISAAFLGGVLAVGGGAVLATGIVVLDDNRGEISYTDLSSEDAKKLGISEEERLSYNDETDLLNVIQDDILGELASEKNITIEQTTEMWKARLQEVSPSAQKVAAIISANILQQQASLK